MLKQKLKDIFKDKKAPQPSFQETLNELLKLTHEEKEISLKQLFSLLSGKGYASLIILCSFPFCLPLQIPGLSTPFGIILSFIGLRILFGKRPWWPKWLLDKKFPSFNIEKLTQKTLFLVKKMEKILKPRFSFFIQNIFFHRLNGFIVFLFSFVLALPLPIPFTNLFAAFPILFLGLGLLEEDGLFILLGYFLTILSLILFSFFILFAKTHIAA